MTDKENLALIRSNCTEEGNCWLWNGGLDGHGRPQKRHKGKTVYVRRVVRELADGEPVPPHLVVPASCGNKLCVSPECSCRATHKTRATMAAKRGAYNNAAKTAKQTAAKRAKSWITEDMVEHIRAAPGPASRIAEQTKVSLSHVKAIRRGDARRPLANPFGGLFQPTQPSRARTF